jgi:hypothetical protein
MSPIELMTWPGGATQNSTPIETMLRIAVARTRIRDREFCCGWGSIVGSLSDPDRSDRHRASTRCG